jgi:phosphotransferase system HPr (HPr) family protein
MIKKQFVINNSTGLHARPAALFVEIADRFKSDIDLNFEGVTVNAKSVIGVLSLGIGRGDTITLTTNGVDEEQAMTAIERIINSNFGENGGVINHDFI